MFVLVLAAENDETRQTVSLLIVCLVGIAIALAALTVWYWFYTDPKRRPDRHPVERPGAGSGDVPVRPDASTAEASDVLEAPDAEFVTGAIMASQTWDFVAAAKRAEGGGPTVERRPAPAAARIAVPDRAAVDASEGDDGDADELAVVRRRREREAARGLSDEAWRSVRRSVFEKLDD